MGHDNRRRGSEKQGSTQARDDQAQAPGRRTLSEQLEPAPAVAVTPDTATPDTATSGAAADPPVRALIQHARSHGGAALDPALRTELEASLDAPLGDVRIHASGSGSAAAQQVEANAFAYGQDIFFGAGQYDPSTPAGRALIAHEVAHTVQQRGARDPSARAAVSSPGEAHEVEADRFMTAFFAGSPQPAAPVVAGSLPMKRISRQPAGTPAPSLGSEAPRAQAAGSAPATPGGAPASAPADAFTIQPAQATAVIGPTMYRVPGAEDTSRRDGRFLCTWTIEHDPASEARNRVERRAGSWAEPRAQLPWRWTVEGSHKVICDVTWQANPNAPRTATPPPPPPSPRRLELAVQVRTLANLSRDRFDEVARTDAYFDARLRDRVQDERARQPGALAEAPRAATERRERLRAQDENSARIEAGRQVIARAQLTRADGSQTTPLAIAIGPATGHRDQLTLIDFTPGMRRMDYGLAASTAEAIAGLEARNSYPAGLVEIDVPANEHGVAPLRRTFRTTGESSMGAWSSNLGAGGMAAMAAGGVAVLATSWISVPLFIAAGLLGGASSAVSMAERLRDARPDPRGIAIDALGVASAILGAGGVAALGRTVSFGGRTMRVVDMTGRLALAADATQLVLMSSEGAEQILRTWNEPNLSETQRLERIAGVIVQIAAQTGLVVVSGAQQVQAARAAAAAPGASTATPHAATPEATPSPRAAAPEPSTPPHDAAPAPAHANPDAAPAPAHANADAAPAPAPANPDAAPAPAHATRDAAPAPSSSAAAAEVPQTPQDVLREMQEQRRRAIAGSTDDNPRWRQLVGRDTTFVRIVAPAEVASLANRGRVVNTRVQNLLAADPIAAHQRLAVGTADEPAQLFRPAANGRMNLRGEYQATRAGNADPVIPISAHGPAPGYTGGLEREGAHQRFLVKFRSDVRRMESGNNALAETEYFIPAQYQLRDVEWIADVRANEFIYGAPGRAGTQAEVEALRARFGPARPHATRPARQPHERAEEELLVRMRGAGDLVGRSRNSALIERFATLRASIQDKLRELRQRRGSYTGLDEETAADEMQQLVRQLDELTEQARSARPDRQRGWRPNNP